MKVIISISGKPGGAPRSAAEGYGEAVRTGDAYAFIILGPIFTLVGGVSGGIKGATESEPPEIALEPESVIDEAANAVASQIAFQDQVINDLNILTN